MTPVQRVAADLTYLADRYEDFLDARLRGTARPWQRWLHAVGHELLGYVADEIDKMKKGEAA